MPYLIIWILKTSQNLSALKHVYCLLPLTWPSSVPWSSSRPTSCSAVVQACSENQPATPPFPVWSNVATRSLQRPLCPNGQSLEGLENGDQTQQLELRCESRCVHRQCPSSDELLWPSMHRKQLRQAPGRTFCSKTWKPISKVSIQSFRKTATKRLKKGEL